MFLVDIYAFRGIKPLLAKIKHAFLRKSLVALFWSISVFVFILFILYMFGVKHIDKPDVYIYVGHLTTWFLLFYMPKLVFVFFVFANDLMKLFAYVSFGFRKNRYRKMNNFNFLYQLGLLFASILFALIWHGVSKGKFNYKVMHEQIHFEHLPTAFKGLKIVQISDLHLGSLNKNFEKLQQAVDLINQQKPDLIFFTGDLVNNFAAETSGWAPILSKMKANVGKYSILGNHDYGDYTHWSSPENKEKNLEKIKEFHKKIGFHLLLNENVKLCIHEEEIALIGVENWGRPPFPQYGNLSKSLKGTEQLPFKILLTHDPSHWNDEVMKKTNIDLSFAGHTHGMQFGIEYKGIKWSPIQYRYPRWGGLYKEGNQYLYVNRGLGYIGFPGRIGMPPEITLIELI